MHINNIKSATDIMPNVWQFELKQPFKHKSGCEILLDFETAQYSGFVLYRNKKGTILQVHIREQIV